MHGGVTGVACAKKTSFRTLRGNPVDSEPELRCMYVGRGTMASPAVGYDSVHNLEQVDIIPRALA